jgi:NADPH2:quinone reductase
MGMAINYGTASGQVEPFPLQRLHSKSLIVTRPTLRTYIASRADLEASSARLFDAARCGMLRLEVGSRYRLADIRTAHDDLESRRTIGAPILLP